MAIDYNPAGILNAPFKWDVTIIGAQVKTMSNGFYLDRYNLLSSSDTVYVVGKDGYYSRYAHASATINLFHIRYQLSKRSAISVGGNVRSYTNAVTSPLYYSDSLTFTGIAARNLNTPSLSAAATSNTWAELTMAYARVLSSNTFGRWQAGVQLSVMRAISGAYATVSNVQFESSAIPGNSLLTNGYAQYGYSSNYDRLDSNNSTFTNIKNFMRGMAMNVGVSAGIEYVRYWDDAGPFIEPRPDDYNWKLSVALLDIGTNTFTYSGRSAQAVGVKPNTYASSLENKFNNIDRAEGLNDSLRSIAQSFRNLNGRFSLRNPTRLVINFDKQFDNDYFLNAELQLNTNRLHNTLHYNSQETTIAAVTARKETSKWGVYVPLQYTTTGKVWLGLAGKAGPLLIGLHNLSWLFSKHGFPNGGAYVSLRIIPGNRKEKDNSLACPTAN
ncbi:hypothetical protein FLA_6197 [Filimonas lacunae]|nr:hypothetical protein FLA_6197 [Filimonas lacunae]